MPYKTLIVDDDDLSIKVLEKMVTMADHLKNVGNAKDAIQANSIMQNNPVDIVLLDIEMPEMNGLQFINTLRERPEIILVTSQKDYATEAFDYEVTDYLLKPVSYQRFMKAINRATANLSASRKQSKGTDQKQDSTIFIKERNQFTRLDKNIIQYVEAYGDYVNIYTPYHKYTINSTMKSMEKKLDDERFMRVHRSYIVNIELIESFDENILFVQQQLIPVGGNYKRQLLQRLGLS
jgi:two-component system LytT family response regulator